MSGYAKIFSQLLDSSIWQEPHPTKLLWITMILMADKHGEIMASVPGLAARAGITLEEAEEALATFLSPDPHSRSQVEDGRRIAPIQGGWELINFRHYRRLMSREDQKEAAAKRQARRRRRQAAATSAAEPPPPTPAAQPDPSPILLKISQAVPAWSRTVLNPSEAARLIDAAPILESWTEENWNELAALHAAKPIDGEKVIRKSLLSSFLEDPSSELDNARAHAAKLKNPPSATAPKRYDPDAGASKAVGSLSATDMLLLIKAMEMLEADLDWGRISEAQFIESKVETLIKYKIEEHEYEHQIEQKQRSLQASA